MPKTHVGVSGAEREVKKIVAGVSGVNRECKEAWAGVNGVNRKVFSMGLPSMHATWTYEVTGINSQANATVYVYQNNLRFSLQAQCSSVAALRASAWMQIFFSEPVTFRAGKIIELKNVSIAPRVEDTRMGLFLSLDEGSLPGYIFHTGTVTIPSLTYTTTSAITTTQIQIHTQNCADGLSYALLYPEHTSITKFANGGTLAINMADIVIYPDGYSNGVRLAFPTDYKKNEVITLPESAYL